jgi:EmrB/QacA subfamily drug resistance transporter
MLTVALPELRGDFEISHAAIGWLVSSYLIAMAIAQPLGGRLGDQLGRSRVFQYGLIAFAVLSVAAALSPTFPVLVILRTGQGLVGAAIMPNGMGMLRQSVPTQKLGTSSGTIGSIISAAAAIGPLLGAGLLTVASWRVLFFVNIPLVIIALAVHAALRFPRPFAPQRIRLDWLGGAAFAALLISLTFVLNSLHGGVGVSALAGGIIALVAFAGFFLQRQRTTAAPVAEWRLFKIPSFAAATGYVLLANLVMYTTLLTMPFLVQEFLQGTERATGLMLGLLSVVSVALAPIAGRTSDAFGRRLPAQAGAVVMLCSVLALIALVGPDVSYVTLGVVLAAMGFGLGLSFGPASTAAIESAPREFAGSASGTNSMMRYLGSIVGAGVLGAVLSDSTGTSDVWVFRAIFVVLLVAAALATVATFFIHRFAEADETAVIESRLEATANV